MLGVEGRQVTAEFRSILFPPGFDRVIPVTTDDALHDLALDQIVDRLVARAGRPDTAQVDLGSVFRSPLGVEREVLYRQAVFVALESPTVRAIAADFSEVLRTSGAYEASASASHDGHQRTRLHLTAVQRYVSAVLKLAEELPAALHAAGAGSEALFGLLDHVQQLTASADFQRLQTESAQLEVQWRAVRYNVWIRGSRVTVAPFDDEPDLSAEVEEAFARFRQGATRDYRVQYREADFDHVQGWVLEKVAHLFPDLFAALESFMAESASFVDPTVARFSHELRFYLTYLDYLQPLRSVGLATCYPVVSAMSKVLHATATFDLALARTLVAKHFPVVPNDFTLRSAERILVISGPNQGGKSTAARTIGQLHHLAALGCPVPGSGVRIFLPDRVLTQFEREEQLDTLEGRLGSEVDRIHGLLEAATPRSVIILNEIFTSTALEDARVLTAEVLKRVSELDALCVCVTFIDELSRLNEKTVSMVSAIDPTDPAVRTFKVERRPADGRAYALALAGKHELTFAGIVHRLEQREARS